ncbi:hypothetical protein EG349_19455 [Chryseobacterium shandongense]|uniref:Uncharacterized protein n=2 Tax=Chryseobacterium TaxID=59732 RepID=A0AAD0YI26_9FLAO|nr:hypothetical protein [Chryseobacterium shandongense]AZA88794.1 hypothetical protein EG349_19455 [Chryseobacterium shandongense]AZA97338.1 hypothetical protein EG353_18175 [Chryseobacterium shandongense]
MNTPLHTIFSWFQSGDFPTEAQFKATFSSFYHKDYPIPIANIEGLEDLSQLFAGADAFQGHLNDSNAHSGHLALLNAGNLTPTHVNSWKSKLGIVNSGTGIADLVSVDNSLMIDAGNNNIESNVSIFSEEFKDFTSSIVNVSFPIIQVLGVYDGGLRLNSGEYRILSPIRIELLAARKNTLSEFFPNNIEIQYTHLKTDL